MGAGFCSLYRGSLYQGLSVYLSKLKEPEIGKKSEVQSRECQNHNISLLKYLIFLVRENIGPILKLVMNDLQLSDALYTTATILFFLK